MPSRCDLHVHSRHSDRPSEWYLERIGAPESFSEPLEVYRLARARGMDFVTLTDHDTIAGALEIAHLPGVFVSCEVTARFAGGEAEVHVLAWGLDEQRQRDIDELRGDVVELVRYLAGRGIPHALAHPLFRVDDRLTLGQLEQCLLLFRRFELVNGSRDPRAEALFAGVIGALTPSLVATLADRHGLEPVGPEPWRKGLVGGSDDHSGLYVGTTWTETPAALSPTAYLERLALGDHRPGGESGSSLKLARAFQGIAHDYYRQKVLAGSRWRNDPLAELLRRLAAGELDPGGADGGAVVRSLRRWVEFLPSLSARRPALALPRRTASRRGEAALARAEERAVFEGSARLAQQACVRALAAAATAVERGRPLTALESLSTLATGIVALSPYVAAFRFQHKDEPFHRAVADRFPGLGSLRAKSGRVAWATDTLTDVNGVARTVATGAALARRRGVEVTVLASLPEAPRADFELENFPPIWQQPLPRYEQLWLRLPPFAEVVGWLERERFAEIVISTPGPVGLTALAAAKLLGLPVTAIHHTDFPRIVGALAGGERMAGIAASLLRWFLGQADRVLVSSESSRAQLARWGLPAARLGWLPRGVDGESFHPGRRRRDFWSRWSVASGPVLLFVGRLAPDKSVDVLLEAFRRLGRRRPDARLAVVGDGPLRAALAGLGVDGAFFCGVLEGDELAAAYASADLFVLPSRTDTFGNVVLEAMASGLPVVVGRDGGPAEQIRDGDQGWVLDVGSPAALAAGLERVLGAPWLLRAAGRAARETAERRGWDPFLDTLFGTAESVGAAAGARA